MVFANDRGRYAVCCLFMRVCRRPDLWNDAGPSILGQKLRASGGATLSPGERVMLLATFAFFGGDEMLHFAELARLDPPSLYAVGSLLAASAVDAMAPDRSPTCVDLWLADEENLIS